MHDPVLQLQGIEKSFGAVRVLEDLDLNVQAGQTVVIAGASGSGKTTLLGILGLLEEPSAGEYLIRGRRTADLNDAERSALRSRTFGLVFQQFSLISELKVWQNVARPMAYAGVPRSEQRTRAMALLQRMNLLHLADRRPAQLSGGEQQRVAIARALVNDPAVVLADEPTAHLPKAQWTEVLQAFEQLRQAGKAVVVVTHDPDAFEAPDTQLLLAGGKLEVREPVPPATPGVGPERPPRSEGLLLDLLGPPTVRLHGERLNVTPRQTELIALLALHPDGLSGEQLLLLAYGDGARAGALKTAVSRLRALLPVGSLPYRLGVEVEADFLAVTAAISKGELAEAVRLYRGPLLPQSDTPAIVELREHLAESLRQAVLGAGDVGLAFDLATVMVDDLELWDAALAALPTDDPRRALALAGGERTRRRYAQDD